MSNRESPHFSGLHGTHINVITFLGDITLLRSDKFFQSYPEDVILSWGSGGGIADPRESLGGSQDQLVLSRSHSRPTQSAQSLSSD